MSETIDANIRHPNCEHTESDCRIVHKHWVDNPIEWAPIYDGAGAMINQDPNKHVHELSCATCSRSWQVITEHGESRTVDKA